MSKLVDSESFANVDYKPWLVSIILLIFDILSTGISFFVANSVRIGIISIIGGDANQKSAPSVFWMIAILIIGLFLINGLYPGARRTGVVELQEIVKIVTTSFVILGVTIFVLKIGDASSRSVFIIAWPLTCLIISFFRLFLHNRGSLSSWWSQPVLMVGYKNDVIDVNTRLIRARRLALKPVVALILDKVGKESIVDGIPYYPYSLSLQNSIWNGGVKQVVFVSPSFGIISRHNKFLHLLSLTYSNLIYVMGESPLSSLSIKPIDIIGQPALQVRYNLLDPLSIFIKRITELLICFVGLSIAFPLFLFLAILIRLDSPGPILFKQKRMGKGGRIFELYKFRTMEIDAEKKLEELLAQNKDLQEEYSRFHKLRNDPRITVIGRFLRKSSLDEFPQIWNVIRGDISLVGPRAYLPREKEQMGDAIDLIQRVNPGLTGWWQVMGRHDLTFEERLKLDEFYIVNFSLWMDFYILAKTFWVVMSWKGE